MLKYFFIRLLRGCVSVVIAISVIIILLFFVLDKSLIFAEDEQYQKLTNNQKTVYMYTMWEKYGYLTRVTYNDYLHDYPFGYEDEDNYYVYGSGETVFPFVDVSDGMYKCAAPEIVACSPDMSIAELALRIAPVFIADTFDEQALAALENSGIDIYVHS